MGVLRQAAHRINGSNVEMLSDYIMAVVHAPLAPGASGARKET
jgi:hypothetical protein